MFLCSDAALGTGTQKGLLDTFCSGRGDLWVFSETTVFCIGLQEGLYA